MSSLYKLSNEFNEMVSQLEEYDLDPEVFHSALEGYSAPIEQKVENIVKYMKSLEALAEAKKAEAKRLSESAASDLKKVEWFKNYMADNLQKANINKLQAGVFALSFRKGSEVVEIDESKLPKWEEPYGNDLYDVIPESHKLKSKSELKKLLKDGLEGIGTWEIPGVALVRKPDTLQIKL